MSKIKIKTKLNNVNKNFLGILKNNEINYNDESVKVNIIKEKDKIIICRKNNEYELFLTFKKDENSKGFYKIKNLGNIDIDIYTSKLIIEEQIIQIKYKLSLDEEIYEFDLELEEF